MSPAHRFRSIALAATRGDAPVPSSGGGRRSRPPHCVSENEGVSWCYPCGNPAVCGGSCFTGVAHRDPSYTGSGDFNNNVTVLKFAAAGLRRMRSVIALVAALAVPAARADDGIHVALVGGLGLAQGQAGGHVELRKAHLAVFGGTGLIFSTALDSGVLDIGDSFGGGGYGAVVGARWYFGDLGDRLFFSSQLAFSTQKSLGDPAERLPGTWHHSNASTVTAGWRFKWSGFFLDTGAGAGFLFKSTDRYKAHFVPDITLAIGFEI